MSTYKRFIIGIIALMGLTVTLTLTVAQTESPVWVTGDGGGGVSESDRFTLVGTVGQWDATGQLTESSNRYRMAGGFFAPLFYPTYTISGYVRDSDGTPLAGVTIVNEWWKRYTTTTDNNGQYIIEGLPAGVYMVEAQSSDYDFSPRRWRVRLPGREDGHDFKVNPEPGNVIGRVTNKNTGAAIPNVFVNLGGPGGTTNSNGDYATTDVAPGTYGVWVRADGYHEYRSEVTVLEDQSTTHNIVLEPYRVEGYRLPYPGGRVYQCTQGNGGSFSHTGKWNYAFDFNVRVGHEIVAAQDGIVRRIKEHFTGSCLVRASWCYNSANYIRVRHNDGTDTLYWHLQHNGALVNVGDHVRSGQVIGLSGLTGFTTGPHLDFTRHRWDGWVSIPISFVDVGSNGGVPQAGGYYQSDNYPVARQIGPTQTETDTEPPIGDVQFRMTGGQPFTLSIWAADYASDVTDMRLATTNEALQTSAWQTYESGLEWDNPEVWIQFRDSLSNTSNVYSDTVETITYEPMQTSFVVSPTACLLEDIPVKNESTPLCRQCGWQWDFGDGTVNTEAQPQFPDIGYAAPGDYTISLTGFGADTQSSATSNITILPAPTSTFTMTRSGATVTVEASEQTAATWQWIFGDGMTATGRIASHTYSDEFLTEGNNTSVQLIVTDENGCTNQSFQFVPDATTTQRSIYLPIVIK